MVDNDVESGSQDAGIGDARAQIHEWLGGEEGGPSEKTEIKTDYIQAESWSDGY